MRYPEDLISRFHSAASFAEAASSHPLAPKQANNGKRRSIDAGAVYQWKQRNAVPWMWRDVVTAMSTECSGDTAA